MTERRARIRTSHDDPETVAAALRPDDTPSMATRVEDGAVVTEIGRERTGGLRSTVDDYLVNLRVADRVVRAARGPDADADADSDADDVGTGADGTDDETDTHDTHDT